MLGRCANRPLYILPYVSNLLTPKILKKQAESILWEIAKGDAIPQGEKTIYPSVRERISALTTLGKWEGWDKPAQKAAEIIAQDLQHTHEAL